MGIGTHEYEELIKAFRAQVRIALSTMAVEQAESDEAISENASQRLKELAESAAILGADQFSALYARLKGITCDHAATLSGGSTRFFRSSTSRSRTKSQPSPVERWR